MATVEQVRNIAVEDVLDAEIDLAWFLNELQRLFERKLTKRVYEALRLDPTSRQLYRTLARLEDLLQEDDFVAAFDVEELFRAQMERAYTTFGELTGRERTLSRESLKNFDVLRQDAEGRLYGVLVGIIEQVRTEVVQQSLAGGEAGGSIDFAGAVEGRSERAFARTRVEMQKTLQGYYQLLLNEQAVKAGISRFLYVGPRDYRNRPFCTERIGNIYSRDEILAMENDHGLPVILFCGGWGCRHVWAPVNEA